MTTSIKIRSIGQKIDDNDETSFFEQLDVLDFRDDLRYK